MSKSDFISIDISNCESGTWSFRLNKRYNISSLVELWLYGFLTKKKRSNHSVSLTDYLHSINLGYYGLIAFERDATVRKGSKI